jgi:ubiquinone biosynthesis monooxygenase Coq7
MRVNHTGEICAQALYRGQLLFNQDQTIHKQLNQAASEEIDHLVCVKKELTSSVAKLAILTPFSI